MASSSPATSSSWWRRRSAVTGAGVASTTASATTTSVPDPTAHPSGARSSRPAGAESRTSTPRCAQPRGQRADERRHAPVERPEEWRPVGVGCGHLGAHRPHEAAPALGGRQQRRERRRGGHVVDRAGVDAADERIDQRVDDASTELVRHEGADGTVADRPTGVGPGQHRVAGEAEHAARAQDAGAGRGPEPRRDPERVPLGQRAEASAGPHGRAAGGDRHERVRQPHLPAQVDGLAPAPQEAVGTDVDDPAPQLLALQRAAEARRGLHQGDGGCAGPTPAPTGELPGRGQATDAAPDDDHPPRRHVRAPRPPRRSDRPAWQ